MLWLQNIWLLTINPIVLPPRFRLQLFQRQICLSFRYRQIKRGVRSSLRCPHRPLFLHSTLPFLSIASFLDCCSSIVARSRIILGSFNNFLLIDKVGFWARVEIRGFGLFALALFVSVSVGHSKSWWDFVFQQSNKTKYFFLSLRLLSFFVCVVSSGFDTDGKDN